MHTPVLKLSALSLAVLSSLAQAQSGPATAGGEQTLPAVKITASADASAEGLQPEYAGGQVARGGRLGVLGQQDNMDTPFSLTAYTQKLIEDQQAASIGDVLLNDPGVRVARGFGNFQQLYMIRGLPVFSDDMSYNGLYGLLPRQYLAAELVERVEVFKGANTFLNGASPGGSGMGGAVNVVPKRATNEPLARFTGGTRTGGQAYMAGDVGGRFADDRGGLRVNAMRRAGDTAVENEGQETNLFSIGADFRQGGLRVSADIGYQDNLMNGTQPSVTIGANLPVIGAPDASRSIGQAWTYSNERDTFGTLRAEYDFSDAVTGWIAAGGRNTREWNSLANPTTTNAAGDSTAYRFDNVRYDDVTTGEMGLRAQFRTGAVGHTLTTALTGLEKKERNAYAFSSFAGFSNNIYNPTPVAAPPANFFTGGSMSNPHVTDKSRNTSLALADTLAFLQDTLLVTVGARYQKMEHYAYDYNTGAQTGELSRHAVSPVGGVVWKFGPQWSVYANYIEGLTRDLSYDQAPAVLNGVVVTNAGQMLEPYKTRQVEGGVKFDGGRIGGSLGIYQSRVQVSGLDANNAYGVYGMQRNRGVELNAYGEATRSLKVLGGVSFLSTDLKDKDGIGAPTTQANLGLEYAVAQLRGLSLDGRVIYTSSQYADVANRQEVPSWTRLDLGARYVTPLGEQQVLTVRGRVENVTGKDYWASAGGYPNAGYLTIGAPRTVVVSASVDF